MASAKTRDQLLASLMRLPDDLVAEVVDFVQFLYWRHNVPDTATLSEAALATSWLTSDEDEAWKTLR